MAARREAASCWKRRASSRAPDAVLARASVCSSWNSRLFRSTGTMEVVRMLDSCAGSSSQRELKSQPDSAPARRSR